MKSGSVLASTAFVLAILLVGATNESSGGSKRPVFSRKEAKAQATEWSSQVVGKRYYLRKPRTPLLVNDEINVVRCVIRYSPQSDLDSSVVRQAYRARLWFEGAPPAPQIQFKLTYDDLESLDDLYETLGREFSTTPLEDAYDWPPQVKLAVRYRYVVLGMNKDMVSLALGGLGYQVDLERLDDERIRETWKLQVTGDTRRLFTKRTTFVSSLTAASGQAYGTLSSFTQFLGAVGSHTTGSSFVAGTSTSQTSTLVGETGFFVFSGLPPQFLHIIFTDDRVTARKTEFVK